MVRKEVTSKANCNQGRETADWNHKHTFIAEIWRASKSDTEIHGAQSWLFLDAGVSRGWRHYVFRLFVRLSVPSREHDISVRPEGNYRKLGTNVPMDVTMKWFCFLWSKVKVTMTSCVSHSSECNISRAAGENPITSAANVNSDPRMSR